MSRLSEVVLVIALLALPLAVRAADTAGHHADSRVEQVLEKPITLEFVETPLEEIVAYLQSATELQIRLDRRALDDVGVGSDSPVTVSLKEVPLETALEVALDDLDLTWTVRGNLLLITTAEAAQAPEMMITRVYRVDDLKLEDPMAAAERWLRQQLQAWGAGGMGGMGGMGGGMFSVEAEDPFGEAAGGAPGGDSGAMSGPAAERSAPQAVGGMAPPPGGQRLPDGVELSDTLVDVITSTIEPSSWDSVGGPGSIRHLRVNGHGVLVVAQTYLVHRKIAQLLEDLRAAAGAEGP
jgi:general secretion pathway protein D